MLICKLLHFLQTVVMYTKSRITHAYCRHSNKITAKGMLQTIKLQTTVLALATANAKAGKIAK